ncbi:unnamed protein product [Lasius platythorax]|uniref:Uncharacterized protein n=1 Tax=Lasius platythorax TaxID=488582 RepID=A0AAV2N461_9HYME
MTIGSRRIRQPVDGRLTMSGYTNHPMPTEPKEEEEEEDDEKRIHAHKKQCSRLEESRLCLLSSVDRTRVSFVWTQLFVCISSPHKILDLRFVQFYHLFLAV